jgi:hypothetical protein
VKAANRKMSNSKSKVGSFMVCILKRRTAMSHHKV